MSSTRRVNKRARIQRRAEHEQMRIARRDTLLILLSRAQRGITLSAAEAGILRAHVEAEIREGDDARTGERGQQRAMEQQRQRVEAAEAAIVELEDAADRHKAEYLSACGTIAAMHEAATGRTGEGPVRGVVEDVEDVRRRAEQAEATIDEQRAMTVRQRDDLNAAIARAEQAEATVDRVRALATDMRTWCSPHGIATQYADDIERALAEQPAKPAPPVDECESPEGVPPVCTGPFWQQRAEDTERAIEDYRGAISHALRLGTSAPWDAIHTRAVELCAAEERAANDDAELRRIRRDSLARAEEAEERLARIRDMADQWKRRLPATIHTATAADAVRYAADGDDRPVMFAVTDAQAEAAADHRRNLADALGVSAGTSWLRLLDVARTAAHLAQRAENTEAGDIAALNLAQSTIRQWKARAQEAEEQTTTQLNRARMWRQKAIETDDRADTYRAAWHSARDRARKANRRIADTRRYVEAAYSADMCDGVREDLRRLLDGQPPEYGAPWNTGPEVITDRATIRNTLAEEPTR